MRLTELTNSPYAMRAVALCLAAALASPARCDNGLEISILEGRDARHKAGSNASSPTSVQVRTGGKPVRGARVRFQLPEFGPSGKFPDGAREAVAITNEDGTAYMTAFRPNAIEGRFTVVVDANYGGMAASSAISHSNVMSLSQPMQSIAERPAAKKSQASSRLLLVLGIGAAAAAGGVFATRGGGSRGTPTTVSVGGVGVGGGN